MLAKVPASHETQADLPGVLECWPCRQLTQVELPTTGCTRPAGQLTQAA
jgi:hypothetical protein